MPPFLCYLEISLMAGGCLLLIRYIRHLPSNQELAERWNRLKD